LGGLLSDPSCCVLKDGRIASAVEQAKVSRHDRPGAFPDEAFQFALEAAGIKAEAVGCVAIARPFASASESMGLLELQARFPSSEIAVVEHHQAHAASAYYCSPFQSATVLSIDRAGDYRSAALYDGERGQLTPVREMYFPDSLGNLFNRVTDLLGFKPRADEHKVQWLSTSGTPNYLTVFQKVLGRNESGWPRFDRSYLDADRLTHGGFSARFFEECGLDPAQPFSANTKADLARSLQTAIEEAVIAILGPAEHVCLAGGLTLNSFLVRALEERFRNVFVQPVGGNAGTSLGAALHVWHNFLNQSARIPFETLCLGPSFSLQQTKQALENCKLRFRFLPTQDDLIQTAVRALNDYKIVAWMQGRMEFGPRALGNRSILASPLNPYSTENLNVYIKHRENFRKFAASVPQELADKYFEVKPNANYLATVSRVRPEHRETFAAAILGDGYVRVHTVRREENPLYHSLLLAAGESNGLPALYNTSFNLFGDPLVCTPRDAVRSFYSSGIDALFAGHFYLEK
jgi:carbamoyltransferase